MKTSTSATRFFNAAFVSGIFAANVALAAPVFEIVGNTPFDLLAPAFFILSPGPVSDSVSNGGPAGGGAVVSGSVSASSAVGSVGAGSTVTDTGICDGCSYVALADYTDQFTVNNPTLGFALLSFSVTFDAAATAAGGAQASVEATASAEVATGGANSASFAVSTQGSGCFPGPCPVTQTFGIELLPGDDTVSVDWSIVAKVFSSGAAGLSSASADGLAGSLDLTALTFTTCSPACTTQNFTMTDSAGFTFAPIVPGQGGGGGGTAVPEPSSAALLLAGLLGFLWTRGPVGRCVRRFGRKPLLAGLSLA